MEEKWFERILIVAGAIGLFLLLFSVASAAGTVCQVANGCVGTSTAPTYGKLLVGDSNGNYELISTSSLNIASSTLLSDNNTFTQTLNLIPGANEGLYVQNNNLAATSASSSGIFLQNATAAVSGTQQSSPNLTLEGQGWATTGATSEPVDWTEYVLPVQAATPTGNLTWASSVNNAAFTTRLTLTSAGILEPTSLEAAGVVSSYTSTNANFYTFSSITASAETLAQYIFGGASEIDMRTGFYGSTATTLGANYNYASVVLGSTPITEAGSGNHSMITNLAVKPVAITSGSATVSNTSALYIDGASSATVSGNNYDLYASSTAPDYFGGPLTIASGTSTATGINLTSGCFAISGTCIGGSGGSGTVTSVGLSDSNSTLTIGGTPITTSGTLTATLNLSHANSWTGLQTFANASTTLGSFGTIWIPSGASETPTQAGQLALDTTNDQLKVGDGSQTAVFDQRRFLTFTYATSTAWTATTTLPLGTTPAALILQSVQCYTDAGSLNVQFQYGSTPIYPAMLQASTTIGTFLWSASNTPSAGNTLKAAVGTPVSSPTTISCTATALVAGT